MSAPIFIEPVINREPGDCTISCLVMWTGKPYPEVIAAAPAGAHKWGMFNKQIIATAATLGTTLVRRRKFDVSAEEGILVLNPVPAKGRPSHAVILLNGKVLDPYNGRLWLDVETFLRVERWKVGELLTEEDA